MSERISKYIKCPPNNCLCEVLQGFKCRTGDFLLYDCKHVVVIQLKPQLHNQGERTRRAHPSQERGEALGIGSCLLWCAEDSRGSVKLQCKAGLAAKRSMTPSSAEGIYACLFFFFTLLLTSIPSYQQTSSFSKGIMFGCFFFGHLKINYYEL